MIGLTPRGKTYGAWAIAGLALLLMVYLLGRRDGSRAAKTAVDEAAEAEIHAAVVAAQQSADSLEVMTRNLLKLVELSKVPHARAVVRTDSAGVVAEAARKHLAQVLADSLAQLAEVRAAADSLLVADSILNSRFTAERAASLKRLSFDSLALASALRTIEEKNAVIELNTTDRTALLKIIADLKGQQPSVVRRGVSGVLALVGGAACGAAGSLAGPAVAVGGALACAAVVGAIAR